MNLDKLRPAWKHYKAQQALEGPGAEDVLAMIEASEGHAPVLYSSSLLLQTFLFLFLLISCQGG
ncbi:MAG: hypothetical protein AAFV95_19220 [Bacteroidota bacterium]